GSLEYVGRKDGQVKVRGYRVELGEIERVVSGYEGVKECVVGVRGRQGGGEGEGEKVLVAYVVGEGEGKKLREYVKGRLPEYMVPGAVVRVEEMPLTGNGKVDRRKLAEMKEREEEGGQEGEGEEERAGARTVGEELVAGIWGEVLGVERVGMEENFFDLGGHSLLAMQVVSRVGEVMGVEIRLREVFEAGNVRKLAERVEERIERGEREGGARAGVKRRGRTEHVPLSYEQQRLYFLQEFDEHSWYYNVPVVLRLKGRVEEEGV